MTKLHKVNEVMGTLEDVYPNLIIISGKSIAVPVDKKHVFENTDAKIGDIIRVKYDERGFLMEAELVSKGMGVPEKKPTVSILEAALEGQSPDVGKKPVVAQSQPTEPKKPEPVKEYVSLRERLIVYQTCHKESCETARCLMLIPDGAFDEEEYNRLMDIAVERAKKDAKALIEAAGDV
jgi:hypothetical protein